MPSYINIVYNKTISVGICKLPLYYYNTPYIFSIILYLFIKLLTKMEFIFTKYLGTDLKKLMIKG